MQGNDLKKQLEKDIAENLAKIEHTNKIAALTIEFPDLKQNTSRWHKVYYSSAKANERATHCTIYHSCGCCNDAPLFVSAYLTHDSGIEIYAEPYRICIGEKDYTGGDRPDQDWRAQLTKAKLPQSISERVEAYFKAHAPYEDDEE